MSILQHGYIYLATVHIFHKHKYLSILVIISNKLFITYRPFIREINRSRLMDMKTWPIERALKKWPWHLFYNTCIEKKKNTNCLKLKVYWIFFISKSYCKSIRGTCLAYMEKLSCRCISAGFLHIFGIKLIKFNQTVPYFNKYKHINQ